MSHPHRLIRHRCRAVRCRPRRQICPERPLVIHRQPHHHDLLLLHRNDLLSQATKLLVIAVFHFGIRHVDRGLMVRHHHRNEIAIDVTSSA